MCESLVTGLVLRAATLRLQPSPSASLDAQLLLAHVLGTSRAIVLAHTRDYLTSEQVDRYGVLIERRAGGEPIAYLRGYTEWYGSQYIVTPEVLIPRPETELLLERAVTVARDMQARVVVDVGTGSGALASQLALHLPEARVYATDISRGALKVAAQNLHRLGIDHHVTLLHGNLAEPLPEAPDLIVANLPYLSSAMMETLEPDVRFEPAGALAGGGTGLELYRELLQQVIERGWQCALLFEIDPRQSTSMRRLIQSLLPGRHIAVEPDYAGHDRMVIVSDDG